MNVDKSSASDSDSEAGDKTSPVNAGLALKLAMSSMRGHADFATLEQIHQVAVERYDLGLSMEDAADLLAQMEGVRMERAAVIEQSRVFAAKYWKTGP